MLRKVGWDQGIGISCWWYYFVLVGPGLYWVIMWVNLLSLGVVWQGMHSTGSCYRHATIPWFVSPCYEWLVSNGVAISV